MTLYNSEFFFLNSFNLLFQICLWVRRVAFLKCMILIFKSQTKDEIIASLRQESFVFQI